MDFDEFATMVRDGVDHVGHGFTSPDDDWSTMAFLEHGHDITLVALALETTPQIVAAVRGLIAQTKATKIALVTSTWMVDLLEVTDPDIRAKFGRDEIMPEDYDGPGKYESVVVSVFDAEIIKAWNAIIERHPDAPPTLGEWQPLGDVGTMSGAMVEPIHEALR